VIAQVPDVQVMLEPAPAVWVQLFPAQPMLQLAPHVPVQVAPEGQEKLQLEVELEHASNAHV